MQPAWMATKPRRSRGSLYQTPAWRERRAAVIARTTSCEWCSRTFGGKVVATVHHTGTAYTPSTGKGDEEGYLEMRDDEVVVICRGCHFFWHEHGLKPGDLPLTCRCGKWKEPQFETCLSCHLAETATGSE